MMDARTTTVDGVWTTCGPMVDERRPWFRRPSRTGPPSWLRSPDRARREPWRAPAGTARLGAHESCQPMLPVPGRNGRGQVRQESGDAAWGVVQRL